MTLNDAGMTVSTNSVDQEDFRSFLLSLRPIMSKGEDIYIRGVMNILTRALQSEVLRKQVADWRAELNETLQDGPGFALISTQPLNGGEDYLDLIFNGGYFHDDPNKRARLEQLSGGLLGKLVEQYGLGTVISCTTIACHLGDLIQEARRHKLLSI